MTYRDYIISRDKTWNILLDFNITKLPIKVTKICDNLGIIVRSYSAAAKFIEFHDLTFATTGNDGFSVIINGISYIFYDDSKSKERIRFTISHELGHYVNNHVTTIPTPRNVEPSLQDDDKETIANIFAARLLAPACVLWGAHISSPENISRLCNISFQSANFRAERLKILLEREQSFYNQRGRTCFLISEQEKKVYENFKPFIEDIIYRGFPDPIVHG